jgi:hypothetical protein
MVDPFELIFTFFACRKYFPVTLSTWSLLGPTRSEQMHRVRSWFHVPDCWCVSAVFSQRLEGEGRVVESFIDEAPDLIYLFLLLSFFFFSGLLKPIQCPKGFVCSMNRLAQPNSLCPAGHYCLIGTKTLNTTDEAEFLRPYKCWPHSYCLAGVTGPYQNKSDVTSPQPCPAGRYCQYGADSTNGTGPCTAGHFCTLNTSWPIPTEPGFFALNEAATEQTKCAQGFYADNWGLSECTTCADGNDCPSQGLHTPIGCPAGTYRVRKSNISDSEQDIDCQPCPAGTWAPLGGTTYEEFCLPCPPGSMCKNEKVSMLFNITHYLAFQEEMGVGDGKMAAVTEACIQGKICDWMNSGPQDSDPCRAGRACQTKTIPAWFTPTWTSNPWLEENLDDTRSILFDIIRTTSPNVTCPASRSKSGGNCVCESGDASIQCDERVRQFKNRCNFDCVLQYLYLLGVPRSANATGYWVIDPNGNGDVKILDLNARSPDVNWTNVDVVPMVVYEQLCPQSYWCEEGTEWQKRFLSLCSLNKVIHINTIININLFKSIFFVHFSKKKKKLSANLPPPKKCVSCVQYCPAGVSRDTQLQCPDGTYCSQGCGQAKDCVKMPSQVVDTIGFSELVGFNPYNQTNSTDIADHIIVSCHVKDPNCNTTILKTTTSAKSTLSECVFTNDHYNTICLVTMKLSTWKDQGSSDSSCEYCSWNRRNDDGICPTRLLDYTCQTGESYCGANAQCQIRCPLPSWCSSAFAWLTNNPTKCASAVQDINNLLGTQSQDYFLGTCGDGGLQPLPTFGIHPLEIATMHFNFSGIAAYTIAREPDSLAMVYPDHFRVAVYERDDANPIAASDVKPWHEYWSDASSVQDILNDLEFDFTLTSLYHSYFRFEVQIVHGYYYERYKDIFDGRVGLSFKRPEYVHGTYAGGSYRPYQTSSFYSLFTEDTTVAMPLNLPQYSGIVTDKGTAVSPAWLKKFDPTVKSAMDFTDSKFRNTRLDFAPYRVVDSTNEFTKPTSADSLQKLSAIKPVADKYWDNMDMVPFPWVPYVMQCEPGRSLLKKNKGAPVYGFAKYLHFHALMENPDGCVLPDRDDPKYISNIWSPLQWLSPKPAIADECNYYLRCRFMEDHLVTDAYLKWFDLVGVV